MRFFATRFSRMLGGLLSAISCIGIFICTVSSKHLKYSPLSKGEEASMSENRDKLKIEDKWNVEALYPNPMIWEQEFKEFKGNDIAPRWPELVSYKGKLSDPS